MNVSGLPQTDSIQELAHFWDTHDLTELEDELEEVGEHVFERDTMQPEYDFSQAERGLTAARYAEGTNVVVLDPDVAQFFPGHEAVNEALRHLVAVIKSQQRAEP